MAGKPTSHYDSSLVIKEVHDLEGQNLRVVNSRTVADRYYTHFRATYDGSDPTEVIYYKGTSPHLSEIACVADVDGSLAGKYFSIYSAPDQKRYYVWYSVAGAGTDPAIANAIGIKIDIQPNDSTGIIALATHLTIKALHSDKFVTERIQGVVKITTASYGEAGTSTPGTSGFTIQNTAGTQVVTNSIVIEYSGTDPVYRGQVLKGMAFNVFTGEFERNNDVTIDNAEINVELDHNNDSVTSHQGGTWNVGVTSSALPTGASTSALQTTGNTTLTNINGKLDNNFGVATSALRTAAQIGTATGPIDTGFGVTTTQTLRTVSDIYDAESQREVEIGLFRELKVAEWTRLIGGNATSTLNTRLWNTTGSTGSGAATVSNGLFVLSTGTTANSSAIHTSNDVARYISTSTNVYVTGIRLPDGGTVNNVRKWGAFNATDGLYFKMTGTTLSVCRLQNGVETSVTTFNGSAPVVDGNFHTYEIYYVAGSAQFFQDRKRIHTLTTSTSSLASTLHFPIRTENTNINGLTTNLTIEMRGNGIHRFGRPAGRPKFDFVNTAGTSVLKTEPGSLHRVFVNKPTAAGTGNITLYDNTAASGKIIAVISLSDIQNNSIEFDVDFNIGLTVVSDSATIQFTVIWE